MIQHFKQFFNGMFSLANQKYNYILHVECYFIVPN